jgi:hypothetical protein
LSFDERLALRKEKATASMAAFKIWMLEQLTQVLPKSPIGVALQYALNQWVFSKSPIVTPEAIVATALEMYGSYPVFNSSVIQKMTMF